MTKYNLETKKKAYQLAKLGTPFKAIQNEIGPNPKAIMRYIIRFSASDGEAEQIINKCKENKHYKKQ